MREPLSVTWRRGRTRRERQCTRRRRRRLSVEKNEDWETNKQTDRQTDSVCVCVWMRLPNISERRRWRHAASFYALSSSLYRHCRHCRLSAGPLKMRECMVNARYEQNCKCRKCRSEPYGTPTRDYTEKALSYLTFFSYTVNQKTGHQTCVSVTSSNANRFSKFLHWWIYQ